MSTFINRISILVIFFFLAASCSDDDDNGSGSGSGVPSESPTSVSFDISGEMDGVKTGVSNFFINVGPQGSSFTFENRSPDGESPFWKLEFAYTGSDTVLVEEGTYTIGNVNELAEGDVDFTALFIEDGESPMPMTWSMIGEVSGTLVIEQVGANQASGSFEMYFDDPNNAYDALTIENGVFEADVFVAYIE